MTPAAPVPRKDARWLARAALATVESLEARRLLAAYYFSGTGSDAAGAGTTTRPFRSPDAVRALLASGDALYFRAGDTFASLGTFTTSGLTLGTYARTANDDRATIESGTDPGVVFRNVSDITVADLAFFGAGSETAGDAHDGIAFVADTGKFARIRIDNVSVRGYGRAGIGLRAAFRQANGFDDVRITNSTVTDGGDFGILVSEGGFSYPRLPDNSIDYANGTFSHTNVTIDNCTTARIHGHAHPWALPGDETESPIWGSGIFVSETRGFLIQRSRAFDNGGDNFNGDGAGEDIGNGGPVGIWFANAHSGTVQFCESFDNVRPTSLGRDGGGFNLDQDSVDCTLQYNYSHGNDGGGYVVVDLDTSDGVSNGNVIRYNLSENDARTNQAGIYVTGDPDGLEIYHNTVFVTPGPSFTGPALQFRNSDVRNVGVRNNILVATGVDQPTASVDGGDVTLSGNAYYNASMPASIFWKSETARTLAGLRTRGQEVGTGFAVDPRFARAPGASNGNAANFRLVSSSPLIDQGLDLSAVGINRGARDHFGTAVRWGPGPDVGAVEFDPVTPMSATVRASLSVNLTWPAPALPVGAFVIERKAGARGAWAPIARAPGDATSFLDTTAAAGGDYFYRIWVARGGFTYPTRREMYVSIPRDDLLSLEHGAGGDTIRAIGVGSGGAFRATINGSTVSYGAGTVESAVVFANAGNDTIDFADIEFPVTLSGGAGDDAVTGGDANDVLDGDAGDDHLTGGPGRDVLRGGDDNDTLSGSGGNDVLAGGLGDDTLSGDAGTDWADYGYQRNQVKVSLNDLIDDKEYTAPFRGAVTSTDWIRGNVENLTGGRGHDAVVGNGAANVLRGGAGNDTLTGLAGRDQLTGHEGRNSFAAADNERDTLTGGAEIDALISSDEEDILESIP